jgi:hypothetical protein
MHALFYIHVVTHVTPKAERVVFHSLNYQLSVAYYPCRQAHMLKRNNNFMNFINIHVLVALEKKHGAASIWCNECSSNRRQNNRIHVYL